MAKVIIPTPLRQYAGKQEALELQAPTVGALLEKLVEQHGDLKRHLYTDDGNLRTFVNVYLNDEDIRYLEKENTPVKESDVISIVPSIAGGSEWSVGLSEAKHLNRRNQLTFCAETLGCAQGDSVKSGLR